MRPLKIAIKNFGAIPAADIDLNGITCAAIAGPNGAGKSTAFTIAPMFALFGTTKAGTSADDMVKTGTSEAAVTFDFDHHGSVWRVIRTRSIKGKGKSTLELQRQSGEPWASESGASIAETQKKIVDLLGLDEETFSSSSMILQGRANEFTSRPAGQRKAILAQVLQLDQYESLQDAARAKVAATNISLERDKAMLAAIDARLADRSAMQDELVSANMLLADTVELEKKAEAGISFGREELAKLILRQQQADQIMKQISPLQDNIAQKMQARTVQQDRLDKAAAYLQDEQGILVAAADYDRIRDQVTALQAKDDQRKSLARDGEQITIDLERIESQLKKVHMDICDNESLLLEMPGLEAAAALHADNAQKLTAQEEKKLNHDRAQLQLADAKQSMNNKRNFIELETKTRQDEITRYETRAAMLADAQCIDIERAECRFLADAKAARAKIPELQKTFAAWKLEKDAELAEFFAAEAAAERRIAELAYDSEEHSKAKVQFDISYMAQQNLMSRAGTKQLLETLQEQRTDLETRQAALTERRQQLREDYKKLRDELAELPTLSEQLAKLEKFVKQREMLPAIQEQKKSAQEQVAALDAEIEALKQRIDELKQQYFDTVPEGGLVSGWNDALAERQRELNNIGQDIIAINIRIGALTAKLEALDKDAADREEIASRMAPLAKELTRWQTLVKAFGRDGIPALIIENAVPELERIANDILGQMSGGRHNLRFETQRELKSKSGMTETLDIIVGDWAGERIYETFSGGEQLRIDFAIRFALAELLARRAGSRIDWLTIDEGWGSQSDEYLPLVIEAVKNIAGRFGMVLVISHIKQVQESFEQQITFHPNAEAVEVKVA